jgi:hypothetical protein
VQAGVQVWFYIEDRQRDLDSPIEKLMLPRHTDQARLVVQQLTGGRLTTPTKGSKPVWLIELEAPALLAGLPYQCGTSPEGFAAGACACVPMDGAADLLAA